MGEQKAAEAPRGGREGVCVACCAPEGLALHVLICQTVVGETLVPHGVASVSQGLCAQLGRLSGAGSHE